MSYYSFVAIAQRPVGIPDPMILLDSGVNTFTAQTDDLEGLLDILKNEGVTVTQVNKLDDHEEGTAQDLLLPGEAPHLDRLLREEAEADS